MNRNGNSANSFLYVCNGKKSKELFASTLNGIPISVRCVSSMIIAKFAQLLAAHANIEGGEKRRSPTTVPCFASRNTLTFNFYRSFDCARKKRVYYILSNDLCKLIEVQIYDRKKRPFSGYSAVKQPKHSKFAITNIQEIPVNCFCCSTRASTLIFAITLLTQVPVQRFPFLLISVTPCMNRHILLPVQFYLMHV